MLEISHLSVRFKELTAVNDISLQVRGGEIFGFLGPNGAGKTTTLSVLTGQRRPSYGKISISGFDLVSQFSRIKPLFGYVPDYDNHFEDFTARENLAIFRGLYGAPRARVEEVLNLVELRDAAGVKVRFFSKGMKKKLLIAREMLHAPRLLYLDEPTANLDLHSVANIRKRMRELRAGGTTIFLTTHNMEEAEELCDRIAIIDRGQIVEIDTPANFRARHGENLVFISYEEQGREERRTLSMNDEADRKFLAALVETGRALAIHSREFDFRHVFLKLTGREFK